MTRDADLEELARRYLDLWQDQVTALANDAETAEALERFLALTGMAGHGGAGLGAAGLGAAGLGGASPWGDKPWGGSPWGGGARGAGSGGGHAPESPQAMAAPWLNWPATMMAAMSGAAGAGTVGGGPSAINEAQDRNSSDGRATGRGDAATGSHGEPPGGGGAGTQQTAGAASAAASSQHGAGDVEQLLRRIAELEERLAALESGKSESGAGAKRRETTNRSRKRRS